MVSLLSTILDVQPDCATFESSHPYVSTSASPTSCILYCTVFLSHSSDMKCVFAEALNYFNKTDDMPDMKNKFFILETDSLWTKIVVMRYEFPVYVNLEI